MGDSVISALSGERVLKENSLATVTNHCVVVRIPNGRSRAIISLERISKATRVITSYPGLLVIAGGLFLIAAAAHLSKDGGAADLPAAILGALFVVAYLVSRTACVALEVDGETIDTVRGSLGEAAAVVEAIRSARERESAPLE